MTLEELQVVITAQTAGLRSELGKVNTQLNSVQKQATRSADGIGKAFSKAARVIAALGIGKVIKDSFVDAAQVNTNIENLSKILGENSTEFMNWANGQATAFGIAKKEAMSYGMTFANLVSGFSGGTAQTTQITTQLLQTSSVIASKTGRSMEDVMERIRSGMLGNTEAVEDLGIYASASAMQQTQAYKTMANGTPWNKLDYYTKQQIITFGLLEQASIRYGNTMSGGLTTQMLIFRAELSNLRVALGQAFVPIVSAVIPYLIAMIKHIQVAMSYVVAFVQLLFGVGSAAESSQGLADTAQETSNYLGSSAGNAGLTADNLGTAAKNAKKLKGALAGFDEINTLNMDDGADASGGSGGGGAGGGSIGSGIEVPTFDKSLTESVASFNDQVETAKEKILKFADSMKKWLPIIAAIGAALAGLWIVANLGRLAGGFAIVAEGLLALGGRIPLLGSLFKGLGGIFETISGGLYNFLGKLGLVNGGLTDVAAVSGGTVAIVVAVIAAVVAALVYLWNNNEEFREKVTGVWNDIVDIVTNMWTQIQPIFTAIKDAALMIWEYGLKPLWTSFVELVKQLVFLLITLWDNILKPIVDWLLAYVMPILVGIVQVIVTVLGVAVTVIVACISAIVDIITWLVKAVIAIIELLVKYWNWAKEVAINVFTAIKDFIGNACTNIGAFFSGLWDGIVFVFSVVGTFFSNTFTGAFNGVKKAFSSIGSFFSGIWDGIKSVFGGVADWFGGVFTKAWTAVKNVFSTGGKIFDGIKDGILNGLKAVINGLIGGINKVISIPFKGINWALGKIKNISILGVEPFGWIETISVPEIPRLAKGGIVDSAQMFIAGEAGKEAVMPLENNTEWITDLAEKVATRMPQGPSNDRPLEVTLQVGSSQLGRVVIDSINKVQSQEGKILLSI